MIDIIFYALYNILDKVLGNVKTIVSVRGSRIAATLISMLTGYIYAFVLMSASYDINPQIKGLIMAVCGGIAMFAVKTVDKKLEKTKLWEVKISVNKKFKDSIETYLKEHDMDYYYNEYGKHITFGLYCETKAETKMAEHLVKLYDGKYFVTESRTVFK